MAKDRSVYITTPLFYPSDKPHLGHAFTVVLADVLKLSYKQLGYGGYLVVGTDEHGEKMLAAADAAQIPVERFVESNVIHFKNLWEVLGIKYDRFVRTSDHAHRALVKQVFLQLLSDNQIFIDEWRGWYCTSCEESFSDRFIGKKSTCPIGHPLILRAEKTYFLRVTSFRNWLRREFEANKDLIYPDKYKTELMNNFINDLDDLSITREGLDWGIKVPEDEDHTIYVWFDALVAYLTALNFGNYGRTNTTTFKNYWESPKCRVIQIIGKEVCRFHAIYWPIMLKNLKVRLFDNLLVHGWLLMNNEKMSKSKKNVIDPKEILSLMPREGLRFYLARINILGDANVNVDDIFSVYNSYLVNTYGNLISRFYGIMGRKYENTLPSAWDPESFIEIDQLNIELDEFLNSGYEKEILNNTISPIVEKIFEIFRSAGKLIEKNKAWELEKGDLLLDTLMVFIYKLLCIGTWFLHPILIDTAPKLYDILNISSKKVGIEYLQQQRLYLKKKINDLPENLFPRIKEVD
ncbi:Methionyl-tRNA synthetase [Mycoplasma haemocanis str. Illinois]|uniref:Methionine--tRNA ligase n=1 Tax=Mycoplasma haemocanis (strain Illinois) TaxID=1111676 RepID=H6N5Y1_MYCHN|nr:methionine--tRNA ligase [Mycoplasma haemocanis]AEW44896.1 Methionyl-tRNA synthetase [Mycoplasma haemocanis str. Illinois]